MIYDKENYTLGKRPIWAIMAAILVFIAMSIFVVGSVAMGEGSRLLPIYSVETEDKKVAVTFNCAWEADDIAEILKILKAYDAKATFFILGQWAKDNPDEVKMIADAGHEIGTHSNTHPNMAEISVEEMKTELVRSCEHIKNACGVDPKLFRAPSGSYSSELIKIASEMGFTTIQWDVDSRDWMDKTAEEMVESVTKNIKKGSIILFHSGKENTLKALPQILEVIRNAGYESVGVSELIYKENYTIDHTGRQHNLSVNDSL